jgi:hypothetical protein
MNKIFFIILVISIVTIDATKSFRPKKTPSPFKPVSINPMPHQNPIHDCKASSLKKNNPPLKSTVIVDLTNKPPQKRTRML